MIGAGALGGAVVAIPAVVVLGLTAGGCWLNGTLQDPPLSECIADCSFGDTPCFDECVDNELEDGTLLNMVLFPQCVPACRPDDDNCLTACRWLLPSAQGGSGILAQGEWADFGPFALEDGVLVATMLGTGDADLYVHEGAVPTLNQYDCRPYTSGSNEECRMEGAGTWYVSVYGYASPSSTFELTVEVDPSS